MKLGSDKRKNVRGTVACVVGSSALLGVAIACSSEPLITGRGDVDTGTSNAAVTTNSSIPCPAREAAVTANTSKVSVTGNALVNAYDSSKGLYGGTNVQNGGIVRAATTVDRLGGTITGRTLPQSPAGLVPVPVPGGARNLPLGAGAPGNVNVNGVSDSITLAPGNYVVNSLTVNSPGQIKIQPAGQVNVFVKGTLNLGGTENSNGVPNNLTFFVGSTSTVNVNSGGKLFGNIYAPKAPVNVNSVIDGSVVGSTINLNSGAQVHYDEALMCPPPPIAVEPPRTLPLPPNQQGCFVGTANGWVQVDCVTQDQLDSHFGIPLTGMPVPSIVGGASGAEQPLFQYGEVDVTFAAYGMENNDGNASEPDSLSVQVNTNFFAGNNNGDMDFVQFVLQSDSQLRKNAICVWNFDTTAGHVAQQANCLGGAVGTLVTFNAGMRPGHLQSHDFGTVGGSLYNDVNGQPVIGVVAQLSWFDPGDTLGDRGLYSVVGPDLYGLRGRWTEVSGTVFGEGGGSKSVFQNSTVVTRVLGGSCANAPAPVPDIPWPGLCPNQPLLLNNAREQDIDATGETNNLMPIGAPVLASYSPDLVYVQWVGGDTGVCSATTNEVYVKDNPSDTGVVPSNPAGEPFWESPDLFVVPQGTAVTVNSISSETLLTEGQNYDAYVRVNNDLSCTSTTGVTAHVFLADPNALSSVWSEVSVGYADHSDRTVTPTTSSTTGIAVPAGQQGLLGPFRFTAPMTDATGGHKCILAAIKATGEPAVGNETDAPDSYQVAQRNLQIDDCAYPLTNATTNDGFLTINLTISGVDPTADGNHIDVFFDDPSGTLLTAWQAGQGYTATPGAVPGTTVVELQQLSVDLPQVTLPAGTTLNASAIITLLPGSPDATLSLQATLKDVSSGTVLVKNGGSCVRHAGIEG